MIPILDIILSLVFEVLFTVLFDVMFARLIEQISDKIKNIFPYMKRLRWIGLVILGVALSVVSLIFVPTHMIHDSHLRMYNLLFSPSICGYLMKAIGEIKKRNGKTPAFLESFGSGFIVAFVFVVIRFVKAI